MKCQSIQNITKAASHISHNTHFSMCQRMSSEHHRVRTALPLYWEWWYTLYKGSHFTNRLPLLLYCCNHYACVNVSSQRQRWGALWHHTLEMNETQLLWCANNCMPCWYVSSHWMSAIPPPIYNTNLRDSQRKPRFLKADMKKHYDCRSQTLILLVYCHRQSHRRHSVPDSLVRQTAAG